MQSKTLYWQLNFKRESLCHSLLFTLFQSLKLLMLFTGDGEVGAVKWTVQTLKTYFEEKGELHFSFVFVFINVFVFVFLVLIGFVCIGLYKP